MFLKLANVFPCRFQNNNIFASKSTSQPASDGNKADRFPLYIVNIPVNVNEVGYYTSECQ